MVDVLENCLAAPFYIVLSKVHYTIILSICKLSVNASQSKWAIDWLAILISEKSKISWVTYVLFKCAAHKQATWFVKASCNVLAHTVAAHKIITLASQRHKHSEIWVELFQVSTDVVFRMPQLGRTKKEN